MKRLFSILLALALFQGLVTPGLAAATAEPEKDFVDGYYEAYEQAYEEGYTKGKGEAGGTFGITTFFEFPADAQWETGTYDEGLVSGKSLGYEHGYRDGFFADAYDKGREAGYPVGLADSLENNDYANEPQDIDQGNPANYTAENMYKVGFVDGYWEGIKVGEDQRYQEEQKKAAQKRITEKGGTVDQINVMLNGTMVAFPDVYPELKNDRTMVPIRAIAESLGCQVEYLEGQVVQITREDTTLTLAIGGDTVKSVTGHATKELKMDAVSYVKDDRTYVPLRFVSEAMGLAVHWDQAHRTVVLLDQSGMAAELDAQFTVLNGFLAHQATRYQTPMRIDSRFAVAIEVIDSINGNKTHTISGDMVSYTGDGAMTMEGSLDLTSLTALVKAFAARFEEEDNYSDVLKAFAIKQSFAMKITPEGRMYLKMPMLAQLVGLSGTETPGGDVWYDLGNPYGGAMPGLSKESTTMGTVLTQVSTGYPYVEPFYYYDTVMEAGKTAAAFAGDSRFQKSGSTYTCTLTLDALGEILGLEGDALAEMKAMFSAFTFKIQLNEQGDYTVTGAMKINLEQLLPGMGTALNLELSQNGSDKGESSTLLLQLRNLMNITITGTNEIKSTNQLPDATLPADAVIIDLNEL